MKILNKEELFNLSEDNLKNVYTLSQEWRELELISSNEQWNIKNLITSLNLFNFSSTGLEHEFSQLFSHSEIPIYKKEGNKIDFTPRSRMAGIKNMSDLYLLIKIEKSRVCLYGLSEQLNRSAVESFIGNIYWLFQALREPDQALKELNYYNFDRKLPYKDLFNKKSKI